MPYLATLYPGTYVGSNVVSRCRTIVLAFFRKALLFALLDIKSVSVAGRTISVAGVDASSVNFKTPVTRRFKSKKHKLNLTAAVKPRPHLIFMPFKLVGVTPCLVEQLVFIDCFDCKLTLLFMVFLFLYICTASQYKLLWMCYSNGDKNFSDAGRFDGRRVIGDNSVYRE